MVLHMNANSLRTPSHRLSFCLVHALTVLLSGLLVLASDEAAAQHAKTRVIVSQDIPLSNRRIVLDASKAAGAFRDIRLINHGARIRISNLRIVYSDGTFDEVRRTFRLSSGERTRILNSGNTAKFVDKVIANIRPVRRRRGRRARTVRLELQGTQTAREARLNRRGGQTSTGLPTDGGDNDVLFGYRTVGFDVDREEIKIGRDIGRFSHLRLRVFDNDVFIRDVRIDYVDGSTQFVPFSSRIKKGQTSDWFEVRDNLFIDQLVLIYRARPGERKTARIEVAGQYANNWLAPSGEGRKFNDGWVLLGAETAGSIGYDTDTISVGRNQGGFRELRLNVRYRTITLRELSIIYVNGRKDVFKMTRRVDPGQTIGPLALANGNAPISKIVAKYRSRLFFGKGHGTAVVEIWARH